MKNKNSADGRRKIKKDFFSYTNTASGLPEDACDMVNRYGTYEIQPTADTDNNYPAIAQGYNRKNVKTDRQNGKSADKKRPLW